MRFAFLIFAVFLAAVPVFADAIRPMNIMPGYRRTIWTVENGAPASITAIAQSRDGYLWLGTPIGLYKFDGVEFERLTQFERRNGSGINYILVSRTGDIWLGYGNGGVGLVQNGRLINTGLSAPARTIRDLVEAPNGDIWVISTDELFRFSSGRWSKIPMNPAPRQILITADETFWVLTETGLSVRRPGSRSFDQVRGRIEIGARMLQDPQGRLLVIMGSSIRIATRDPSGRFFLTPFLEGLPDSLTSPMSRFSRDGRLWLVGASRSIMRLPTITSKTIVGVARAKAEQPIFEAPFATGAYASPIFEDREDNIWLGTRTGIERLRPVDLVHETEARREFLDFQPGGMNQYQVLADGREVIYLRLGDRLYRLEETGNAIRLPVTARPHYWDNICGSLGGGVWIRQGDQITLIDGPKSQRIDLPVSPSKLRYYMNCIEDGKGRLWVNASGVGLFRRDGQNWRRFKVQHDDENASAFYLGKDELGKVLTYRGYGNLTKMEENRSVYLWPKKDVSVNFIEAVFANPRYLLIGGETGLAQYDGRRFKTLSSAKYSVLQDISGIVQTTNGETWTIGPSGIARFLTLELEASFSDSQRPLRYRLFDVEEGLSGVSETFGFENAARGRDGRLWFATNNGIFSIDPTRLRRNDVPPPVIIKKITAHGKSYDVNTFPTLNKGVKNLQIDFTATSLRNPARVRFRYRLAGVDESWVDPGQRRQAIYTNLSPGEYRFELIAANEDGVWNRKGASLEFSIPPTFLQSWPFFFLCLLAFGVLLWGLYVIRLRRLAGRMMARLEERVAERERIARELHDTLLQGVQGLILKVQSVADEISHRHQAHRTLVDALDRAEEIVAEGRDRVHGLRSPGRSGALSEVIRDCAKALLTISHSKIVIEIEGAPRQIRPLVAEEIVRIAEEALFNIERHARAKCVTVGITYRRHMMSVRIADDGVGIPSAILNEGERKNHFGLVGMRERAAQIGAELNLSNLPNGGTEVLLTIPAGSAYVDQVESLWTLIFNRKPSIDRVE